MTFPAPIVPPYFAFFPPDITTATVMGWYDGSSMTLDGGNNLTAWTNLFGTLSTLSSNGASDAATVVDAAIAGNRYATLNGTDNYYGSAAFTAVAQPFHTFMVIRQPTWTLSDVLLLFQQSLGNVPQIVQNNVSPLISQFSNDGHANRVSAEIGEWYLLETLYDGASSRQRLNDAAAVTGGSVANQSASRLTLGALFEGSRACNLDVACKVMTDGEVTGSDYENLREGYFNRVFNLW